MSFWTRSFPTVLTGEEVRVLWTAAVRYAVCRGTGASHMTARAVRAHLGDIDSGTLKIIARDIRREAEAWGEAAVGHFAALPGEIDAEAQGFRRPDRGEGVTGWERSWEGSSPRSR